MSLEQELCAVFKEVLALPAGEACEGLEYRAAPGWDSVAHMQLVAALEAKFGIMLETDDVIGMSSFLKAKEILRRHGVEV